MSRTVTLAGYAVLGATVLVVQVVAMATARVPTLAAVARWLARRRLARALLIAVWLWLGWHLFVRVDR